MFTGSSLRHIGTSLGLAAALLALWIRLLMPVGWMPVASADHITYVMCGSSHSVKTVDGEAPVPKQNGSDHCAFANMTPALADSPVLLVLPVVMPALILGSLPRLHQRGQMLAWLRPPLRGPPAR